MDTPGDTEPGADQPSVAKTAYYITRTTRQNTGEVTTTVEPLAASGPADYSAKVKAIDQVFEQARRARKPRTTNQAPIGKQDTPSTGGSDSQSSASEAEEGATKKKATSTEQPVSSSRDGINTPETRGENAADSPEPFTPMQPTPEEALLQLMNPPEGQAYQRRAQPDVHELAPWLPAPVPQSFGGPLMDLDAPEVLTLMTVFVMGFFVMMLAFIWILVDLAMAGLAAKMREIRHTRD